MPRTQKPYDATFRQWAVELARISGKPYRDVARDLGISVDAFARLAPTNEVEYVKNRL